MRLWMSCTGSRGFGNLRAFVRRRLSITILTGLSPIIQAPKYESGFLHNVLNCLYHPSMSPLPWWCFELTGTWQKPYIFAEFSDLVHANSGPLFIRTHPGIPWHGKCTSVVQLQHWLFLTLQSTMTDNQQPPGVDASRSHTIQLQPCPMENKAFQKWSLFLPLCWVHILQSFTICTNWALSPGHHTELLAVSRHLKMPSWWLCCFRSTSALSDRGTRSLGPFVNRPSTTVMNALYLSSGVRESGAHFVF